MSEMCRRCDHLLPARPALEPVADAPTNLQVRSAARVSGRDGLHSRTRTARELTIGRKLREIRDQHHLTQQDMATKAGVPRTYISRIENARLLPGPVMLRRIAEALDVTILDLLPPNRHDELSVEGDIYWTSLRESFLRLDEQEMAVVLQQVRSVIETPAENYSDLVLAGV